MRLFGEGSGGVGLIGLDNLGTGELLVGVSGPDDLALALADDGKSGEAVAGAELAAPARGDGEVAAGRGAGRGLLGSLGALDVVAALDDLAVAGVDAELPVADGVVGAAVALGVADGPLGSRGHHGDGVARGGSGRDAGGGDDGEDSSGELHIEGCCCFVFMCERVVSVEDVIEVVGEDESVD